MFARRNRFRQIILPQNSACSRWRRLLESSARFSAESCLILSLLFKTRREIPQGSHTLNAPRPPLDSRGTGALWVAVVGRCAQLGIRCLAMLAVLAVAKIGSAEIELPNIDPNFGIQVSADRASHWIQGGYEVWHLKGNCEITQGQSLTTSREAVLWIDRAEPFIREPTKVIAYLEGAVQIFSNVNDKGENSSPKVYAQSWYGRFHSFSDVRVTAATSAGKPTVEPAAFERGVAAQRAQQIELAQFVEPLPAPQPAGQSRRVLVRPRSDSRVQSRTLTDPETGEQMVVVDNGVRVVVEGAGPLGKIDIEADRIVLWTTGLAEALRSGQEMQDSNLPLEIYMEGNIVFRQGDRVIYAKRMYYDVRTNQGTVLDAEILTPAPQYNGVLRLKADVLQQVNAQNFVAYGSAVTSSRLGVPKYWVQQGEINVTDTQTPATDPFTGQAIVDPRTGDPQVSHRYEATASNNYLYIGGAPVFYWPRLATDLTKPTFYFNDFSIRNDSIFGTQVLLDFDLYQLLGVKNQPEGTDWELSLDYLTQRGFAAGTEFNYEADQCFGLPGNAKGFIDVWGLPNDFGQDNLGLGRRAVTPEKRFRGRVLSQHRQYFESGLQISAETGLISDRNFLEQYYEQEWDENKDQNTGIEIKQYLGDQVFAVNADVRLNDFFNETEWLPRGDHYLLGRSLLEDRLTWFAHTHVGYGRIRTSSTPEDPTDAARVNPIAGIADRQGIRAGSRQEIDLPLQAGPVKVVPFVSGEASYYGDDLTGGESTRLLGQTGVRASLPMFKVDRSVRNEFFNLNGIAHKVVFDAEYFWADSTIDQDMIPLYDALDDNAQEFFTERLFFGTFAGSVPAKYDNRYFAQRSTMQRFVAAPSMDIADDLQTLRFGVHQKWQTKRGAPGQERTVDYIVLDVEGTYFPDSVANNFGEDFGLLDYDFEWHIGDRLAILSDGFFDFFGQGLRTASLGAQMSRPGVGDAYIGMRSIEGPISANILNGSVNYRMSEKWIANAGAAIDFGETGNIGQSIGFTRIGESLLVKVGANYDASRGNFGVAFAIEPRFLPSSSLGRIGGVQIPPSGALGLE